MSRNREFDRVTDQNVDEQEDYRSENLRDSPMMAYLLDALDKGIDIGEYGRLVFAMVARHFMEEEKLVSLLASQPDINEEDARARLTQIKARDYNPPRRERILQWQKRQEFPICPNPEDPRACNVYRELKFPEDIYDNIDDFWVEKAESYEDQQ